MDLYKKIIPKRIRFVILRAFKFVPDKPMVKLQYWIKFKRKLNLENPQRFTEKIQWYKLYYRNDDMKICVDKYRVREYIKKKGMEQYLVPLYAVYDGIEDIEISELPDKFVMKTTNGSGTNIICKDKNNLSQSETENKIKSYLKQSSASAGREWPYSYVVPKIIVEQLLENPDRPDGDINDYKFHCFNGKPEYIQFDVDRFSQHKRNIYDTSWKKLPVSLTYPCSDINYPKPDTLDEMLKIADVLSEGFPYVRVDLYSIKGHVYFGELTFFSGSGYEQFIPDEYDFEMGRKFVLPEKKQGSPSGKGI